MSGKFTLRDDQERAVASVIAALANRPILVSPTGSGKTVMATELVERVGLPTLWLAHRKELIDQAATRLEAHGLFTGVVKAGYPATPLAQVQVASVQTLVRRELPSAGLIVIDECFPSGTLIDGKAIETLRVGDSVRTHNGIGKVTRLFCRTTSQICRVNLSSGQTLICTPNHPIWTQSGFRQASSLTSNCVVATIMDTQGDICHEETNVRNLSDGVRTEVVEPQDDGILQQDVCIGGNCPKEETNCAPVFNLRKANYSGRQNELEESDSAECSVLCGMSSGAFQTHDCLHNGQARRRDYPIPQDQRHESPGSASPGLNQTSGDGMEASSQGRQRLRPNNPSAGPCGGVGVGDGSSSQNRPIEGPRNPDVLQGGHCQCSPEGCYRSGRQQPQDDEGQAGRPNRRYRFALVRVDSVEVLERSDTERFGRLCPQGLVYNLEVSNGNTYFADGVLVHNCHHASADTYRTIIDGAREHNPQVAVVGLTATPFRLDGRGLGDLFGELVVASWTEDLCNAGILHRPKVWAAKSPDLRGVKVIGGDYQLGALSKRTNNAAANADIVSTWLQRCSGMRTVCFAVDVQHSRDIVEAFQCQGIAAEHLDGSMTADDRTAILDRLRSGQTQIVSNCMVLTEGWDLPALQCAIVARPTASLNLHLQMIGRVMRACEGKAGAVVLDHAGNHHVHGLVTRRLQYSLDGSRKVGTAEPLGLRRCRKCGMFFELATFACPDCGYRPSPDDTPARERPEIHGTGELAEFDDARFDYRREVWNLIEAERQGAGFKPGWSMFRYRERFGSDPLVLDGELVDPAAATLEQKRRLYEGFVDTAKRKGFKEGWASYRFKEAFGHWPRGFVTDVRKDQLRQRLSTTLAAEGAENH